MVHISCRQNTIAFIGGAGRSEYALDTCDVTPGLYDASVRVEGSDVDFDGVTRVGATDGGANGDRFDFRYRIAPGQENPATLFAHQSAVTIVAGDGLPGAGMIVLAQFPVEFEGSYAGPLASPASQGLGSGGVTAPRLLGPGLSLHVLAIGEHAWPSRGAGAVRVLTPDYWLPLIPRAGVSELDRLVDELPRDLQPRMRAQEPLVYLDAGISRAELDQLPELIRRFNAGEQLTTRQLEVLGRVADLHVGGGTHGSPVMSFTTPDPALRPDLGFRERSAVYRVRVEVPSGHVLDVSQPSVLTAGRTQIPNLDEIEFQLATDERMRITHVQPVRGGSAQQGWLMRNSGRLRWAGRGLIVLDLARVGYTISEATPEERPIVIAEEAGGVAGGALGTAAAVAGCIAVGVATGGIGLFICGLAGGIAGGVAGTAVAGGMARDLSAGRGGVPCPSCHQMQREWSARQQSRFSLPTRTESGLTEPELRALTEWINQASVPQTDEEILLQWMQALR